MRKQARTLHCAVIALVFLLIATPGAFAFGRPAPPGWQPPNQFSSLNSRPQYVVLLVLDGALPAYFNLADFPHLAALARRGVTYTRAWDGMLETETPTGHAALGTGSLPRRNGIISFGWVNDSGQPEQPTNPIPIQQGQLEQILHQSGVPSIASVLKQHDRNAMVVVTSGHKDYAVDAVGGWAADYLMYYSVRKSDNMWAPQAIPRHVPPQSVMNAPGLTTFAPHLRPGDQDWMAVQLALSAFRQLHQRVTIINLPEFDWPLGHLQGALANTWFAWRLMTNLDAEIASIEWTYQQEHVLNKTLFAITADHGMMTLNHQIPHQVIQNAVASAGASLADYDFHTAGYLWLRDRSKAEAVAQALVKLHNPLIRAVYYRSAKGYSYLHVPDPRHVLSPALQRADQFLLGTLAGPNAPHVAIFLHENTSIQGRNQVGWRGDHGGPTWNAEHIPLLLAGPGVRQGITSPYPATIYDVAPTILSLLGAPAQGMDGVVLANAFTRPDLQDAAIQNARGKALRPLVQAIIAQSKRDGW